jgi:hypothetical protein
VEIQAQIASIRAANPEIVVPEQLTRPHRVIASWLAEHKRLKQEARRDAWGREPEPLTETDHRRHRILDTLFKTVEAKGIAVKQEEYPQRVYFEVQKERVDFQLREKQKQVRRPLTDWENSISYYCDRGWVQELQGSGLLIFTIKTWLPGTMRQEWKDEHQHRLEDDLPEIVAIIKLAGPALVKQRQEQLEAEQRRLEEEHQRYLVRRAREHDEKRWQRFLQLAHRCDQAASARHLIAHLEAKPAAEDIDLVDNQRAHGLRCGFRGFAAV